MRINHTKRILMNEADSSPGGGAVPADSAAPTAAPTAPESPAPLTADAVASIVEGRLKAFENGFFANARKAGLLGKDKTTVEHPTAPPTPQQAPGAPTPNASTGLSMADVEALLERERVIANRAAKYNLTEQQTKRLKSSLSAVAVESFASEVDSYLADMGLAKDNHAAAPAAVVPNAAPISDRGSPAPAGAVGWRYELNNPIGMSPAARAQMDAELGVEKARRMRLDAARNQAATMRVAFGPQGKG